MKRLLFVLFWFGFLFAVSPATLAAQATPTAPAETGTPRPAQPGRAWPTTGPISAQEHFWFGRPFVPPAEDDIEYWYPYGSNGAGKYLVHTGVDIGNPEGTPVLSVAAGRVVVAGNDLTTTYGPSRNFYGNLVILELSQRLNGQPVFVLYGHMKSLKVQVGQEVKTGDQIGAVGMTGIAMGPHLHLEVRVGSNDFSHTRNPTLWLQPFPQQGLIAGRLVDENGRAWAGAQILLYRAERRDRVHREVYTYVDDPTVLPDDAWGENFTVPDLLEGDYILETKIGNRYERRPISVKAGEIAFVLWQLPSKPSAVSTPTPTPTPRLARPIRRPLQML